MADREIWKPFPHKDFHFLYEISDSGRVRNKLTRRIHKMQSRVLLTDASGKHKLFQVNQLVAKSFIPNPHGFDWLKHIDGNILNCRADNLKWIERAEAKASRRLTFVQVIGIRKEHKAGVPRENIAAKYRVNISTVDSIVGRKTWKHIAEDEEVDDPQPTYATDWIQEPKWD